MIVLSHAVKADLKHLVRAEAGADVPWGAPKAVQQAGPGKNKRRLRKRNDESQTVDLMPAWRGKGATRCPGVFFLIQTRVAPSESPTCVCSGKFTD